MQMCNLMTKVGSGVVLGMVIVMMVAQLGSQLVHKVEHFQEQYASLSSHRGIPYLSKAAKEIRKGPYHVTLI
jgi:hypothetical protein